MTLSELLHAHMDDETQQVAVQLKVVVEQWSEDQSFEDKEDLRYLVKRHSVPVKANTLIDLAAELQSRGFELERELHHQAPTKSGANEYTVRSPRFQRWARR